MWLAKADSVTGARSLKSAATTECTVRPSVMWADKAASWGRHFERGLTISTCPPHRSPARARLPPNALARPPPRSQRGGRSGCCCGNADSNADISMHCSSSRNQSGKVRTPGQHFFCRRYMVRFRIRATRALAATTQDHGKQTGKQTSTMAKDEDNEEKNSQSSAKAVARRS